MTYCTTCGQPMRETVGNHVYTRFKTVQIVLQNIKIHVCQEGHVDIVLPAVGELHDLIARGLLAAKVPVGTAEFRFITSALMMDEEPLAQALGLSVGDYREMRKGNQKATSAVVGILRALFNHPERDERFRTLVAGKGSRRHETPTVIPTPNFGAHASLMMLRGA